MYILTGEVNMNSLNYDINYYQRHCLFMKTNDDRMPRREITHQII